ncbi:hypothetical protein ACTFIV_004423 [Dictyostelium citrinum]
MDNRQNSDNREFRDYGSKNSNDNNNMENNFSNINNNNSKILIIIMVAVKDMIQCHYQTSPMMMNQLHNQLFTEFSKLVSIHIITELSGTLNEKLSQYHQCHHPYPTSTPSNTRPNTSSTTTMKKQIKMLGKEQNRVLSGFGEDGIHKSILEATISD